MIKTPLPFWGEVGRGTLEGRTGRRHIPDFDARAKEALRLFKRDETIELRAYESERQILIEWFDNNTRSKLWDAPLVRLAGLAVYGWMPTILRAEGKGSADGNGERNIKFEDVANALNFSDERAIPDDFLNGSPVGTSKFKHFWKPDSYAIWDSNVAAALWPENVNNSSANYRARSVANYRWYKAEILAFCVNNPEVGLRDVELALFCHGKGLLKKSRKSKRLSTD